MLGGCKAESSRGGLLAKRGPGVLPWDVGTGWRNGIGQSLSAQVGSVSLLGPRGLFGGTLCHLLAGMV